MKLEYNGKEVIFLPPMKRYVNKIERKLNLPMKIRARVMSDLATSICARREQGETDEAIMESMGKPAKVAAELNAQMEDYAYRKSPWRFLFLALAIVCGLWLLGQALLTVTLHSVATGAASVGIIGGADGPTAIFVTSHPSVKAGLRLVGNVLLLVGGIIGYWFFGHRTNKHPEE